VELAEPADEAVVGAGDEAAPGLADDGGADEAGGGGGGGARLVAARATGRGRTGCRSEEDSALTCFGPRPNPAR